METVFNDVNVLHGLAVTRLARATLKYIGNWTFQTTIYQQREVSFT